MIRYVDTVVTFSEVPDEISLCINISNCPNNCKNCHSAYLSQDIGWLLNKEELYGLISENTGITCVAFMGGDKDPEELHELIHYVRITFPKIKICWYSGKEQIAKVALSNLQDYDYIKIGPYIEEKGPLNNKNTNQQFYKVENNKLIDITFKFWKNEIKD